MAGRVRALHELQPNMRLSLSAYNELTQLLSVHTEAKKEIARLRVKIKELEND